MDCDGHRLRMRHRYTEQESCSFTLYSCIEMLLFYPIKRIDSNEISHKLLTSCGGLDGLLGTPAERMTAVDGVSDSAAFFMEIISELCINRLGDI